MIVKRYRKVLFPVLAVGALVGCNSPLDRSTGLGGDIVGDVDSTVTSIGTTAEAVRREVPVVNVSSFTYDRNSIIETVSSAGSSDSSTRKLDSTFAPGRFPAGLSGNHSGESVVLVGTDPATDETSLGYLDFVIPVLNRAKEVSLADKPVILASAWVEIAPDTILSEPFQLAVFPHPPKNRYAPVNAPTDESKLADGGKSGDTLRFLMDTVVVNDLDSTLRARFESADSISVKLGFVLRNTENSGFARILKRGPVRLRIRYGEKILSKPDTIIPVSSGDYTIIKSDPGADTTAFSSWAAGRQTVLQFDLSGFFDTAQALGARLAASAHIQISVDSLFADSADKVSFRYAIVSKMPEGVETLPLSEYLPATRSLDVRSNSGVYELPITRFVNGFIPGGTKPASVFVLLALTNPLGDWARVKWTAPQNMSVKLESVLYTLHD